MYTTKHPFKHCTLCGMVWATRSKFLHDPDIRLIGYQMNINNLELGLLLFNHLPCKTTLALKVAFLSDLYHGPIYAENQHGGENCPTYCLQQNNMQPCPTACACVYVREIMQIVQNYDRAKKAVPVL